MTIGANPNTPQATEQTKWQFRDDFSWSVTGMGGLGHDFKAGVNFINEPHLFATFNSGVDDYAYTHLTDDRNGPIQTITRNGGVGDVNIPFKQYAAYVQDDWRVSNRLTLNLGLRYDLVNGVQIDQSQNPNFVALQAAGARRAASPAIPGMEDFGKSPKDDTNNLQPRVGFAYDIKGDGRDVVRGGWGVYQDFGYTNANVLFPAIDASGQGHGAIFSINKPAGILKPDGTFFRSAIRSRASRARTRPTRRSCRSSGRSSRRGCSSRTRGRPTSGCRTSWARRRRSPRTTCTSTDAISTCASATTTSTRPPACAGSPASTSARTRRRSGPRSAARRAPTTR